MDRAEGEKQSVLQEGIQSLVDLAWKQNHDKTDSKGSLKSEIAQYGAEFLKTVPLFMPTVGKKFAIAGYGAAALFNGLDQAKAGDDLGSQLLDFSLGATKGTLTKGSFQLLGARDFSAANKLVDAGLAPSFLAGKPLELSAKAFSFGISSRVLEGGFNRQSYFDSESGQYKLSTGLSSTIEQALSPSSLATDVLVFSGSALAMKGAGALSHGILERSPLAQTIAQASSFGFLSGSLAEVQRQSSQDEHFDLSKILLRGTLESAVTAAAGVPGGLRMNHLAAKSENTAAKITNQSSEQSLAPILRDSFSASNDYAKVSAEASAPKSVSRTIDKADKKSSSNLQEQSATDKLLGIENAVEIGKHNNPSEGALHGAKEYKTESGMKFWQLQDGRILEETTLGTETFPSVWVPYGSGETSGLIYRASKGENHTIYKTDERLGVSTDINGTRWESPREVTFAPELVAKVKPEVLDNLILSAPQFEKDWQARLRILPTADGQMYERTIHTDNQREIPPGTSTDDAKSIPLKPAELPARTYSIMSAEQSVELADKRELHAANKISSAEFDKYVSELRARTQRVTVLEPYAKILDALREKRTIASLSPSALPELREDILKARRELYTSPFNNHLLPEHSGQFLDRLPNRTLMNNLVLTNRTALELGDLEAKADATFATRDVRFFDHYNSVDNEFQHIIRHEWAHLLETEQTKIRKAYDAAIKLEGYAGRAYGYTDAHENWAVNHGDIFLDSSPDYFITLTSQAPIKSVLSAEALSRTLKNAPQGEDQQGRAELQRRIDYVNQNITEAAKNKFSNCIDSPNLKMVFNSVIFMKSMLASPETHELGRRLLDVQSLKNSIDKAAPEGSHSGDFATAQALKLDLLSTVDKAAFESRQNQFTKMLELASKASRDVLLNERSPEYIDKIKLAETLLAEQGQQGLFQQLFPLGTLEQAALNATSPTTAGRLSNLIGLSLEDFSATTRLAASDKPAWLEASKRIILQNTPFWFGQGFNSIKTQIARSTNTELPYLLQTAAKARLAEAESSTPRFMSGMTALMQDTLLDRINLQNPGLTDKSLAASLNEYRMKAKAEIRTRLGDNSPAEIKKETVTTLLLMAEVKDEKLASLVAELAPPSLLEPVIRQSPEIAKDALKLLSSTDYNSFLDMSTELSEKPGPLRGQAITNLSLDSDLRSIAEAEAVIESFSKTAGTEDKISVLNALTKVISNSVQQPELNDKQKARAMLRILMAQTIAKSLDLTPYPMLRTTLSQSISTFNRAHFVR